MADTVAKSVRAAHLLCRDVRTAMVKADLTIREKRARYGRILRRASEIAGLNRQQTADALHLDEGQLGRWWSGDENAQTWRYIEHDALGPALLKAQAEANRAGGIVEVRTVITLVDRVG